MAIFEARPFRFLAPLLVSLVFIVLIFAALFSVAYTRTLDALASDLARGRSNIQGIDLDLFRIALPLQSLSEEPCNELLLAALRAIEYEAEYVRDIARVDGERITCSTTLGYVDLPLGAETGGYAMTTTSDGQDLVLLTTASTHVDPDSAGFYLRFGPYLLTLNDQVLLTETEADTLITFVLKTEDGYIPLIGARAEGAEGSPISLTEDALSAVDCGEALGLCVYGERAPESLRGPVGVISLIAVAVGLPLGLFLSFLLRRYIRAQGALQSKLLRAIDQKRLYVVYQPIVDLKTGYMRGAEALVRWRDTDGQHIRPDIFCSIAEQAGFSDKITDYVIAYTIQNFWSHAETRDLTVAFNVAPQEILADDFVDRYGALLKAHGIPKSRAKFEITERMQVDLDDFEQALERVTGAGFRMALDDFGTGHSSFPYLKRLSLDTIKIDQSFVSAVGEDNAFGRMLPHLVDMIIALGVEVVVEGLEEQEQQAWFAERGDMCAQGYYFSPPVNPAEFLNLLHKQASQEPKAQDPSEGGPSSSDSPA